MKLDVVFKDERKETFDGVVSFNVTEGKTANEECYAYDVAHTPTEGKLFEVNPLRIDRSKFKKSIRDQKQEWTRLVIQEAFAEVDKYPEKYASAFYTLIPEKKWNDFKTVAELNQMACELGDHIADWVEQALEWAQRICNGETLKDICNNADRANWYRVILLKNEYYHLVGGSRNYKYSYPATCVCIDVYDSSSRINNAVPLVVIKKN